MERRDDEPPDVPDWKSEPASDDLMSRDVLDRAQRGDQDWEEERLPRWRRLERSLERGLDKTRPGRYI